MARQRATEGESKRVSGRKARSVGDRATKRSPRIASAGRGTGDEKQRSTRTAPRSASALKEDPNHGGRASERGSHTRRVGPLHSTDAPPTGITITPYDHRRPSVRNAGRGPDGKVLPHKRTARIASAVAMLIAGGHSENDIAVALNMRPGHLRQHYGHELDNGAAIANAPVISTIYRQAKTPGNMRASTLWAKARMGWRDGETGQPPTGPFNIVIHS